MSILYIFRRHMNVHMHVIHLIQSSVGCAWWESAGMCLLLWTDFRCVEIVSPTVSGKWFAVLGFCTSTHMHTIQCTYNFWMSLMILGLQTNKMKMRTPWVMLMKSVRWKYMLSGLIAHETTSMLHVTPIMINRRRKRLKLMEILRWKTKFCDKKILWATLTCPCEFPIWSVCHRYPLLTQFSTLHAGLDESAAPSIWIMLCWSQSKLQSVDRRKSFASNDHLEIVKKSRIFWSQKNRNVQCALTLTFQETSIHSDSRCESLNVRVIVQ